MLIDSAEIEVEAGSGGKGCVSFVKPKGGPDGGDGGDGGNIIIEASEGMKTLLDFKYKRHFKTEKGQNGSGNNKTGKSGKDLTLKVPLGTQLINSETGELIADLIEEKQQIIVAKGGRGGKGNSHFATSTRQTPRFAQKGTPGEKLKLKLELKFIAEVGLIGLPNAGKSTLLSKISSAKPKIADYPFTTLSPNLGVVKLKNYKSFIAADIPGLIEDAHKGSGLGDKFLKHIERTKLLVHLIDITYPNPLDNIKIINKELELYNKELLKKTQIIAINKIDLVDNSTIVAAKSLIEKAGCQVYTISAITGYGIQDLIEGIAECLQEKPCLPAGRT